MGYVTKWSKHWFHCSACKQIKPVVLTSKEMKSITTFHHIYCCLSCKTISTYSSNKMWVQSILLSAHIVAADFDWIDGNFASPQKIVTLSLLNPTFVTGLEKYANLYRYMLGEPTRKFWKFLGYPINKFYTLCWAYLTPLCLVVVLVFNFSEYTITSYGNYIYPLWAEVIGWLIAFGSCLPAVIVALYKVIAIVTTGSKETIKLRLRNQLTSTERWDQNRKILETSNAEELQAVDTKMKF
ncbi:Sodium- and chloride-dependent glycine transporter 1 [Trichinella pseudospiralis]|uniref:Sodium-and chloride-dependent glycine transporter 1 n=1 Tax=Trichinella pseudospiralis TaxID=6337 RepID=A0A0V0XS99_TRIPS|nr:Sodium- and chloride-dependent glycine transporter 1 [Trichinella pseudospiralis]